MTMASIATAPTTIPAIVAVDGPGEFCMLAEDIADVFGASADGAEED
jgi:hypothetical protein